MQQVALRFHRGEHGGVVAREAVERDDAVAYGADRALEGEQLAAEGARPARLMPPAEGVAVAGWRARAPSFGNIIVRGKLVGGPPSRPPGSLAGQARGGLRENRGLDGSVGGVPVHRGEVGVDKERSRGAKIARREAGSQRPQLIQQRRAEGARDRSVFGARVLDKFAEVVAKNIFRQILNDGWCVRSFAVAIPLKCGEAAMRPCL